MRRKLFTTIVTAALTFVVLVIPLTASAVSGQALVNLTNQNRAANGLAGLAWRGELANSAWLKAQDICTQQYWAHTAPDGTTAWQLMSQSGYNYVTAGENLAKGFIDDAGVANGWMASLSHRANILNGTFTEIGVGTATCTMDGLKTTVVVAHYGASAGATSSAISETTKTPTVLPTTQGANTVPTTVSELTQSTETQAPKESLGTLIWRLGTTSYQNLLID